MYNVVVCIYLPCLLQHIVVASILCNKKCAHNKIDIYEVLEGDLDNSLQKIDITGNSK